MREGFNGIYVALLTPYTESGEVDCRQVKRLVRYLIRRGADGFYVGGSTGEAFLLTQEERKRILEAVLEECGGERRVIAHVGQISTGLACDLARHAAAAGADAVSAISPFYYSFTAQEIEAYYGDIMEVAGVPMFLYNFPAASGFTLTLEILDKVCAMGDVAGVKFTSSNFYDLARMRACHPEFTIWNGMDEMLSSGLIAGAEGGIGSSYNIVCPIAKGIWECVRRGQMEEARGLQTKLNEVIALSMKNGRHITVVKAVLECGGIAMGGSRRPFAPLTEAARADAERIYREYVEPFS